jgi:hypothetical protein
MADATAAGIGDSVGDGRQRAVHGHFADALHAERAGLFDFAGAGQIL